MNSAYNLTLQPLDYWLRFYGFPNYLEILYIYVQTPFSVLAFAFNLVAFFILQKNIFSVSRFFKYMRFYVLNNSITSLLLISTFMGGSHRYLTFTNSFSALFYCSICLLKTLIKRCLCWKPPTDESPLAANFSNCSISCCSSFSYKKILFYCTFNLYIQLKLLYL